MLYCYLCHSLRFMGGWIVRDGSKSQMVIYVDTLVLLFECAYTLNTNQHLTVCVLIKAYDQNIWSKNMHCTIKASLSSIKKLSLLIVCRFILNTIIWLTLMTITYYYTSFFQHFRVWVNYSAVNYSSAFLFKILRFTSYCTSVSPIRFTLHFKTGLDFCSFHPFTHIKLMHFRFEKKGKEVYSKS